VYTIVVTLSDPETSFDGGEFYIQAPNSSLITLRPQRLSSVVFLSETPHGLMRIHRGLRETFATELWIHDDVIFGENRPSALAWGRTLRELKEKTGLLDDFDDAILEYTEFYSQNDPSGYGSGKMNEESSAFEVDSSIDKEYTNDNKVDGVKLADNDEDCSAVSQAEVIEALVKEDDEF
jgi:hypothetical protein